MIPYGADKDIDRGFDLSAWAPKKGKPESDGDVPDIELSGIESSDGSQDENDEDRILNQDINHGARDETPTSESPSAKRRRTRAERKGGDKAQQAKEGVIRGSQPQRASALNILNLHNFI